MGIVRKQFSKEEIEFILKNYEEKGGKYCAQQLNRKFDCVCQVARRNGIRASIAGRAERMKKTKSEKPPKEIKYLVEPEQFINVKTPEVAYILGLLWADGHILVQKNKYFSIILSTTHPDIDTFYEIFSKTGVWKKRRIVHKNQPTWKVAYTISTYNKKIGEYLYYKGYKSKSSCSADDIIQSIPVELRKYWFRGLLDGDGSITFIPKTAQYNLSFSSTYEQDWTYLINLSKELNFKYYIKRSKSINGNYSHFYLLSRLNCLKFLRYIYDDMENIPMGLERKYKKYKDIISHSILKLKERSFNGVCKNKKGKWRAYCSAKGPEGRRDLGVFDTEEEAKNTVKNYYSSRGIKVPIRDEYKELAEEFPDIFII